MSNSLDQDHPKTFWESARAIVGAILFPFWLSKDPAARELTHVTIMIYLFTAIGLVVAANLADKHQATAIIYALASAASGTLVGFLFGFPRTLPEAAAAPVEPAADPPAPKPAPAKPKPPVRQRVNTNLEEVSDWLTKIVVGIGLVEARELARGFNQLTHDVNGDLQMLGGAAACGAVLVYFAVVGFFYGYLTTRLFLAGAFNRADLGGKGIGSS